MDQVVQGNAGQTSQLASTANSLAQQATELQTLVSRFQLADGTTQHRASEHHYAPAAPQYTPAPPSLARTPAVRRAAQHVQAEATVPAGGGGDEGFIEF